MSTSSILFFLLKTVRILYNKIPFVYGHTPKYTLKYMDILKFHEYMDILI